jgi:Protein of unknown function (DUF4242)
MATILVEQIFEPQLSDEAYGKLAKKLDPCLDAHDAIWCRSYISKDKTRVVCEFEAPDAESVREAMRSAGMPFERIWNAELVRIEDYPDFLAKRDQLRAKAAGK